MEACIEKLRESLSSLEGVLHRTTAPNLKALEKMREVKDELQGVKEGILFSFYLFNVLLQFCLLIDLRVGGYFF